MSEELNKLVEQAIRVLEETPGIGRELIWAYEYAQERGWVKRHRGERR